MRELMGTCWRRRDRLEYACYLALLRVSWRWLPRRLTLDPLAYHRLRVERIRDAYRGIQLESFAVGRETTVRQARSGDSAGAGDEIARQAVTAH